MSKHTSHRKPKRNSQRLREGRVDLVINQVVQECMPSDHEISRMAINDVKRYFMIMSKDDRKRFWNKLSKQQQMGIPNYLHV